MSVLIIRAHKRFAVCRKARLRRPGKRAEEGLLIELSREGCRLSRMAQDAFMIDQQVMLRIDGSGPVIAGRVRWLNGGTLGLRFLAPLDNATLERLVPLCRGESDPPLRAYGT